MTHTRKRATKKPKDVLPEIESRTSGRTDLSYGENLLELVIKTMKVGDGGYMCSFRSFRGIEDRYLSMIKKYPDRQYTARKINGLKHIWRTA
jgi:hypothetical protein